jgi:GDP-L-fucose synthase
MLDTQLTPDTRIYIAGHTGLIGSAFVRRLHHDGFRHLITRSHAELDLCDAPAVEKLFAEERPEVVVMAAGRVGGIVANRDRPADFITTNLSMQLNLMQSAWHHGVKRFVFFGSSCMYPREASQPMAEELLFSGSVEPTSIAYATAKMAGVQMCLAYNRQYGSQVYMPLIPNSVYGPNDNFDLKGSHVLSALIRRMHEAKQQQAGSLTLWGSGTPRREFIHANDLTAAVLHLLKLDSDDIDYPMNIGTGVDHSIRELATLIARVVDYQGEILWDSDKPDGTPRKLLDSHRILATGWKPEIELEQGLRSTYQWYRESQGE